MTGCPLLVAESKRSFPFVSPRLLCACGREGDRRWTGRWGQICLQMETLAPEMMWTLMRFERDVPAGQPLPGTGTSIIFSLKVKNGGTQTRSHGNVVSAGAARSRVTSTPGIRPGLAPSPRVANTFGRGRLPSRSVVGRPSPPTGPVALSPSVSALSFDP